MMTVLPPDGANARESLATLMGDLLEGGRYLRRVFLDRPDRVAFRDMPLIENDRHELGVVLIRSGFAFRSFALAEGRRAILDILIAGDIVGLDRAVMRHPVDDVAAASRVQYHVLSVSEIRELMANHRVALWICALLAETSWRISRMAISISRLDAQARVSLFLLDIYDRLRRRRLVNGEATFNLPLTQEQIADHLGLTQVHLNRTLRRLRQEGLALVDRHLVSILDIDRLRELVKDFPQQYELPEPLVEGG